MPEPTKLTQLTGVGDVLADRIRLHLGRGNEETALTAIKLNPYLLMTVPRLGFKTADRIALSQYKVPASSPHRHESGNRHAVVERGSLDLQRFNQARQKLELNGVEHRFTGVVFDEGRVWLPEVLEAERQLADWALTLPLNQAPRRLPFNLRPALEAALDGLDDHQKNAAILAAQGAQPVLGITGGAGTGKTRVIGAIARLCQELGLLCAVLTPTGKAADRAREALAEVGALADAMTIHRALGYQGNGFQGGQIAQHVVILDESSMVSVDLLWEVVKRLQQGARLVLVGDPGQLPPVGHGQPFMDLLDLGLSHVHLERNYRSAHVQGIIRLAQAIRARRQPGDLGDASVQLRIAPADELGALATAAIEAQAGQPLDRWQVITWMNEDVHTFNLGVQESLNPHGMPCFTYRPYGWGQDIEVRAGDKVVVRQNDPDYGIFNGQLGVVTDLTEKERVILRPAVTLDEFADADDDGMIREIRNGLTVELRIGTERVDLPLSDARELLHLGYAITVHKAQGSDWEHVLLLQPRDVGFDAARWWYTSVTRARTQLSIFYSAKSEFKFWANTRRRAEMVESTLSRRIKKLRAEASNARTARYLGGVAAMTETELQTETNTWLGLAES